MIHAKIEGLDALLKKISPELVGAPLRNFFTRAASVVQGHARERAPVNTGRLRSSIAYEVESGSHPLWAKVGTNVFYAPYMEFGTGTQTDGSGGGGRHWPPSGALNLWAARHGIASGFLVARAIGRRGGLKPRRYLRGGLEQSLNEIKELVQRMGDEVRAMWEAR